MDIPTREQIPADYLLVRDGACWRPMHMTAEKIDELLRDGWTPLLGASLDADRPLSEQVLGAANRSAHLS